MNATTYEHIYQELDLVCAKILANDDIPRRLQYIQYDRRQRQYGRYNYERHVGNQNPLYDIHVKGEGLVASIQAPPKPIFYRHTGEYANIIDKIMGQYPEVRISDEL